MKVREGGLGFGSAVLRGPGALLAAWETGARATARDVGETTAAGLRRRWPGLASAMAAAEDEQHRVSGVRPPRDRWQGLVEGRAPRSQKEYTAEARERFKQQFEETATAPARAAVASASGPSAGAWLESTEGVEPLADHAFKGATLRRCDCPLLAEPVPCRNRPAGGGGECGRQVCTRGLHAMQCPRGGGPVRRHDAIRDVLQRWLKGLGVHALTEQVIQEWSTEELGIAKLDVVYHHGIHGRICIDVSVVNGVAAAVRGERAEPVIMRRERAKHRRYPGGGLVPFVVDVNGRWGREAETWLRRILREVDEGDRGAARRLLRARVAQALHAGIGEQIAVAAQPG